ncbi:hypothetical protein, partial [Paludisphaera soli]|uniref:hypothetical protein n=1 Tax=Paludisphaera soli TaxID=2712865 RepID=UPI0013EBA246
AAGVFFRIIADMRDLLTENEHVDWQHPYAPGYGVWKEMVELSGSLLPPTAAPEFRAWSNFGRALGEFQLYCRAWEPNAYEDVIAAVGESWAEIGRVRDYNFARRVADLVGELAASQHPESLSEQFRIARRFRLIPRLIDHRVRCGLKVEAPPEVVFVMDEEELIFCGQHYALQDLQKIWIAMLRLLAEQPGKVVSPRDVNVESGLDNLDLVSRVSTLRREVLKPAIKSWYAGKKAVPPPDVLKSCHIKAKRKVPGKLAGGYFLDLKPEQVRVPPHRPPWMNKPIQD